MTRNHLRALEDARRYARLEHNDEWLAAIEARLRKVRTRSLDPDLPAARVLIGVLGFGTLVLGCGLSLWRAM